VTRPQEQSPSACELIPSSPPRPRPSVWPTFAAIVAYMTINYYKANQCVSFTLRQQMAGSKRSGQPSRRSHQGCGFGSSGREGAAGQSSSLLPYHLLSFQPPDLAGSEGVASELRRRSS
jgi:hypothetical protein